MKKTTTLVLIFLLFAVFTNAQSTFKQAYIGAFEIRQSLPLPDGGFLLSGFVNNDSIQLLRYNAAQTRTHTTTISFSNSIGAYQDAVGVSAHLLHDDNYIVCINIFECDFLSNIILAKITPDGAILWEKNIQNGGVFVIPHTDSTFLVGSDSYFHLYNQEGNLVFNNSVYWPNTRIDIGAGLFINSNSDQVYVSLLDNTTVGLPWFSPEPIVAVDTLWGGGYVARSAQNAYFLNAQLDLDSISAIPVLYQNPNVPIIACKQGFVALVSASEKHFLRTLNSKFETISSYDLGKNVQFTGSSFFNPLVYQRLVTRGDKFTLLLQPTQPADYPQMWMVSDFTGINGQWLGKPNLTITDITFGGTPHGTIHAPYYSAQFPDVHIKVKNNGTDTIQHCKAVYFVPNYCTELFGCGLYPPNWVIVPYDSLQLAPGDSRVLEIGDVAAYCSATNLVKFCMQVTEINHIRDSMETDNYFCKFLPNLYVSTQEPQSEKVQIAPNPTTEFLYIQWPEVLEQGTVYLEIVNTLGQLVQTAQVPAQQQIQLDIKNLSAGQYVLRIQTQTGQWATQRFMVR